MTGIRTAIVAVLILITGGCVLKSSHDETLAQNVRLASDLDATSKERDTCQKTLADSRKSSAELSQRNDELSNTNQLLSGKQADISRRCLEMQQELLHIKEEKAKSEDQVSLVKRTYDDLVKTLKDEIAQGQIAIAERGDRLSVNVADQVLFPSGSDKIQSQGEKVLRKVAKALKSMEAKRFEVEGHTDNVPIASGLSSRFPSNWELSASRATKVVRFLEEQGVDPARLAAVGLGEHRPIASNSTAEGRKKNRRTEIVLVPISSPLPKSEDHRKNSRP